MPIAFYLLKLFLSFLWQSTAMKQYERIQKDKKVGFIFVYQISLKRTFQPGFE